MKRIKILSCIIICLICIFITGCGKENTDPNQQVGQIKYYVPRDYSYRKDLRGLFYSENDRKIFAKGDTSDYSSFYYIDMIKSNSNGQNLDSYINNINTNNLKEKDVKFNKFDNKHINVYERNGYETKQGTVEIINYAYFTQVDDFFYGLTVSGPKSDKDNILEIAKQSAYSMQK